MKNKIFFLSAITTCVLAASANQANGASCYNAEACTGTPGAMRSYSDNNYRSYSYGDQQGSSTKVLQTSSTETFVGNVKSVNRVALPNQTQIQLIVSSDQGDVLVILGPASFVDQSKVKFQPGDKITVTGYRVKANGNEVVLAAKVEKNGYSLQLLNDNRQPLWLDQSEQNQAGGQSGSSQAGAAPSSSYSGQGSYLQNNPSYNSSSYSGSQNPKMPNSRY